jgi:chromosomal replication initiation ATPase DnaA
MPEQLSIPLPVREALGRDDFFVSPANAEAVAMIEGWQSWPSRKLFLTGPSSAGKTHLAHVWANLSGARIVPADNLANADIPRLSAGPVAIEDADRIAGDRSLEEALFHLHNLTLAEGNSLLLTCDRPANRLPLSLPDLASRMQGTPNTTLREPDDALLTAVLMKLMADRQLSPAPNLLSYLTRRIDRSFDAARDVVDRLDNMALATGRPINRALAAKVLDNPDA